MQRWKNRCIIKRNGTLYLFPFWLPGVCYMNLLSSAYLRAHHWTRLLQPVANSNVGNWYFILRKGLNAESSVYHGLATYNTCDGLEAQLSFLFYETIMSNHSISLNYIYFQFHFAKGETKSWVNNIYLG